MLLSPRSVGEDIEGMAYTLQRTKYVLNSAAALPAVAPCLSAKEYKKASPVRAELRAAVAWAK
jgi:hypothetical protein